MCAPRVKDTFVTEWRAKATWRQDFSRLLFLKTWDPVEGWSQKWKEQPSAPTEHLEEPAGPQKGKSRSCPKGTSYWTRTQGLKVTRQRRATVFKGTVSISDSFASQTSCKPGFWVSLDHRWRRQVDTPLTREKLDATLILCLGLKVIVYYWKSSSFTLSK